jgi:sulfocyanin
MFVSIRAPLILLLAAGCSGGSDRAVNRDTAAGVTTGAATTDTSTPAASTMDSTQSAAPADSAAAVKPQTAAVAPPSAAKPRVKPSIDPGRKSTTTSSASTRPAAADTAAADTASAPQSAAAAGSTSQDQNLKYDAASNTVTFQLIGGPNGFQFNGYSSGGATLTLPPKANVVIHFTNKDGTPHSAEVIPGEGPIPNASTDPAIPRAYTRQALQGLAQGEGDDMTFTAPASGNFRIFCGVPGHGLSGMWIWMKVDPAAKQPSFGPTKS